MERVTTLDLLTHVLHIPPARQSRADQNKLSPIMDRLGWKRVKGGQIMVPIGPVIGGKPSSVKVSGYWRGGNGDLFVEDDV